MIGPEDLDLEIDLVVYRCATLKPVWQAESLH